MVRTYPGADVPSDHNLLLAKFKIRLKKIKQPTRKIKLNLDTLTDKKI
jgi:mRNA deadenylase 3'-5' endonuclease subunit Ccr4